MNCSFCGEAVAQGVYFCKHCGARLSGGDGNDASEDHFSIYSEVKPELLVFGMVAVLVFGFLAVAVLIGVLKAVAGFDTPFLLLATLISFVLILAIEGVLISLLLSGKRRAAEWAEIERLKRQTTEGLAEAQARALPEPVASVTEHTTRPFAPIHSERTSK